MNNSLKSDKIYQKIDFETNCVKVSTFLKRLEKKYPKFFKVWGELIEYACKYSQDGYYHEVEKGNYVIGVDAETEGHFYVWFQARCKEQIIDGEGKLYNVESIEEEEEENNQEVKEVENAKQVVEETKEDLVYYLSLINKLDNITTVREYISIKANILDFIEEYGCWKDCNDSAETLNLIHYIAPQMVLYWDENRTVQKYRLTDECMRIYKIYTLVLKELLENKFKYEVMYHQDRFYSNDKEKLITGVSRILGIYEEYIKELVEEL